MNTPQLADSLRAAVLQAAIKGELTERSSENARDLLLRIQNEKQALQAKGSLKKTKALPPVGANEVPFEIPENWVWVRLGDVTDYGIGKQTLSEKIPAGSLIVEMEDIEKETYRLLDKNRERTPKSSKNSFVAGDVLYGKLRPYLKKVVVADESGFCSTEIIPFNGFGKINPQYLMFCMTSPFMLSSVNQLTYGMDMPRLGTNDAKNLLIPLPPLAEQQAIVEKLTRLLAEIDRLKAEEQSLASLQKAYPQTLRASVLAAAVRGDLNERSQEHARDLLLRIQNEKQALQAKGSLKKTKALPPVGANEVPFEIPENWVWVRLGDVTDYGIGKQTLSEKIPAGSLIVEMEDIEKETYRLLDKNRERTPKSSKNSFVAGDVLYGKLRPYLKKVVVADESGFCSTEIIPFNGFGKINPQYLMFCMTSPFMLSSVNQLTYGMDMPRLGTNDAKNLLIPLPPLSEQQAIVEKLTRLLAEIDALENA